MAVVQKRKIKWTIPLMLIVVLFGSFAYGKVIYVDDDATGANDGSSWADAYWCLQDALTAAQYGDEIRVAQGIYKPDREVVTGRSTRVVASGDRTATFQLKNGVAIRGGYAGFGEPDPYVRDIELHETILSGDLNGNDRLNFVHNSENSYHVVTGNGTDETAVLDGFTITAGNANGNEPHNGGGGMYNFGGNSSPSITNCTFSGNAAQVGGGMLNDAESSTVVTNCTFNGNSAEEGGGMFNHYLGSPVVTNCTFTGNSAEAGGGMFNANCTPVVTDCTFSGNTADIAGGGMHNDSNGNPIITNCTFTGNTAIDGGGMFNFWDSSPTVANCTFTGNSATDRGGGMFNGSNGNPIMTNCTFTGNTAIDGGGVWSDNDSSPMLTNCILWGNSASSGPQIYRDGTSSATVSYSDVQGGWPGEGNINADPLFVDPDGTDNIIGTEDDDLRLLPGSPCIDAGDNSAIPAGLIVDLDGNPRII